MVILTESKLTFGAEGGTPLILGAHLHHGEFFLKVESAEDPSVFHHELIAFL